jgi:hypothetical protein
MIGILKWVFFLILIITLPQLWALSHNNLPLALLLILNYLLHFVALYCGFFYLRYYLFPAVIGIAILNILTFYLAILYVPFEDFQCGLFDYNTLNVFLMSNFVFYSVYFFFLDLRKFKISDKRYIYVFGKNKLIVFSTVCFGLSFLPIPVADFANTLQYLSMSIMLSCHYRYKSNWIFTILLISLFLFLLIKAVLSTLVFTIVYLYFFCVVVFFIDGFSQQSKRVEFYVISSFLIVFVYYFSAVKMEFRVDNSNTTNSTSQDIKNVFTRLKSSSSDESVDQSKSVLWRLTYTPSALSHIMEKTPSDVPFWNGSSYLPLIFKFIPRFIWPNKPQERMGQDFGHTYNLLADDNLTTSMNAPIIVEAYFNFGISGVILMSIVMGLILSLTFFNFGILKNNAKDVFSVFIVSAFSVYSIQWESNFSMYIGKLIILYFIFIVYNLLFKKKFAI